MPRLIDADRLCEDLMTRWHTADKNSEKMIQEVMADVVTPIAVSQPTIDAVSVVRCKECKYWVSDFHGCSRNACAKPWYADDYCRYGERKESE